MSMIDVATPRRKSVPLTELSNGSFMDRLSPSRKLDFEQWARDVATCHFRKNPDCRVPYTFFMSDKHPYWIKAFIKKVKPLDAYECCNLTCEEIRIMHAAMHSYAEVVVRGKS